VVVHQKDASNFLFDQGQPSTTFSTGQSSTVKQLPVSEGS
jgi:hypothetical protein